ncbi:MAG: VCBS repeat-containing protein [Pedosphaera sp.]|nr:VCBS repeat-containing protein [Pedosphaera sp.]
MQAINPYSGRVFGIAHSLGRTDATALIHVDTNRFIATTATRDVLRVELPSVNGTFTVTTLSRTVAPVSRLARVPCVSGCFNLNLITGTGPIGPTSRAQGFLPGDFNGDGKTDLAITGEDGLDAVIHILHGDGTGKFNAVARHVLGAGRTVASGKLVLAQANSDTRPDLLAAWDTGGFFGFAGGRISVLPGTADGKFAAPLDPPITTIPTASGFTAGSFDGVGTDDLIFADGPVRFLRGDANGTFTGNPAGIETLQPDLSTQLVELADLNGDGRNDLIRLGELLATHVNSSTTASFQMNTDFGGGDVMELGDFDGDGKADLFVTGYSAFVLVFPGNGDGTFRPSLAVFSGQLSGSFPRFAVGDLDGDGRSVVIMPDQYRSHALVLQRPGRQNAYAITADIALATQPIAARIADVNSDGNPDILILGIAGTVEVILAR